MDEMIRKEDALNALDDEITLKGRQNAIIFTDYVRRVARKINDLPSAQFERDIPVKPTETTDKAWGIPHKQAVCPKCDYYLGHVSFLGDYKGKRITYCETCGQAIDWEGWDLKDARQTWCPIKECDPDGK